MLSHLQDTTFQIQPKKLWIALKSAQRAITVKKDRQHPRSTLALQDITALKALRKRLLAPQESDAQLIIWLHPMPIALLGFIVTRALETLMD